MTFHADITHFGWTGVQLFFVLSGFLITGILWKEKFKPNSLPYKFKKFWVRRSLRIFPLYFGYLLLLGVLYIAFHIPENFQTHFPYLVTYTFNYTRSFPGWQGDPLITHLWSLSIEEQFYLFFPLIIFFCSARFIKYLMVVVIALAPFIRLALGEYYKSKGLAPEVVADSIYWNTFSHLDAFFMGGIIPVLSLNTKLKKPQRILGASLVIVIIAGIWNFTHSESGIFYLNDLGYNHGLVNNYEYVWHYTVLNVLFACFLLTLVSRYTQHRLMLLRRLLESKWMVSIGKVSYGMYIYHWGILAYFYARFIPANSLFLKILLFGPYVLLVFLVSALSYRLYESYFIKLKDKWFTNKTNRTKEIPVIETDTLSNKPI